jgi:hypothetical protein
MPIDEAQATAETEYYGLRKLEAIEFKDVS